MFFFFPFLTDLQASPSKPASSQTLPLLPAPWNAFAKSEEVRRKPDFGDFAVDLLRQTISAFTSSLTALGTRANALFAQVAAALAYDRVARDTAAFIDAAWFGFGAPRARSASSGSAWFGQQQDPMAFSQFPMQNFMNPWAAFADGVNFWAKLWTPAAPQRSPSAFSGRTAVNPFTTTVSAPGGFTWGFSWGA